MLKVITTAAGLLLTGLAACAAPASKPAAPLICPVTHEKIASIKDAVGHSTYKGKTYYFCCDGCKPLFDKNPAKYVHPAAATAPAH